MQKRKQLLKYLVFICAALSELLPWFGSHAFNNGKSRWNSEKRCVEKMIQQAQGWMWKCQSYLQGCLHKKTHQITYTLKSFTVETHASSVTTVYALPLLQSDLFQNSSSRWSGDRRVWFLFYFLACCSVLSVLLFHHCLMTLNGNANRFSFGNLSECTAVQIIWR